MKLTGIYCYPIKSLGGIALAETEVNERGIAYDRRWMLVDPDGQFLTQRSSTELALFSVDFESDHLRIDHRMSRSAPLWVPLHPTEGTPMTVQVWDDRVEAIQCGTEADTWFSQLLRRPVHLVYMPDQSPRQIDPAYAPDGANVSFADGYPILILGEATLADLNDRLDTPVPMNRFRPNLVFEGGHAGDEDSFDEVQIGAAVLKGTKPCARCQVITINQDTGEKGQEPMRTLSTYRREGNKVLFGMNMYPMVQGKLTVGDELILAAKHS
ncbi:MAG: MOSC N-terminal beta barrel domain-containing protein [Bacteroidota bacterium]